MNIEKKIKISKVKMKKQIEKFKKSLEPHSKVIKGFEEAQKTLEMFLEYFEERLDLG